MATYFHGNSEIQSAASGTDGLQTLVLMNHAGYIPYADTPPPPPQPPPSAVGNLVFLNSAAASISNSHAPPPQQHHHHQHFGHSSSEVTAFHPGFLPQRVHYNLWTAGPDTPSPSPRDTPRSATPHQQGLSLTLSSQQIGFGSPHAPPAAGEEARVVSGGSSAVSGVTNGGGVGTAGIQSVLLSSKYLKAAQELLEEVVNVGAGIGAEAAGKKGGSKASGESPVPAVSGEGSGAAGGGGGGEGGRKRVELTPAERQEVQMKKAKLINMLDEVDQRYRQYHQQMQIVISSFEQVAGMGSARTYTALALQTISKQFRCLKDAISGQIRSANKSLGEDDSLGKVEGSSRLKFVDHHLRQQRALQQLGMIQHNAWRPQRGLPERSVSVLRAWLFEHFLHPYPKDSDKHMLAKQTGLTRSQVSNWFINARVRLWKPMVEEMYLEEVKENETNNNAEKSSKSNDESESKSNEKSPASAASQPNNNNNNSTIHVPASIHQQFAASPSPPGGPRNHNNHNVSGFSLVSSELEGVAAQSSPKKARCEGDMLLQQQQPPSIMGMDVKPGKVSNIVDHISMGRDGYSFMGGAGQANFIGGFGQYPIADIGRFDPAGDQFTPRFSSGNGVSLTLGLPHCDNTANNTHLHHLSLAGAHQSFVPNQAMQLGARRVDHNHTHHHHHLSIGEAANEFGDPHSSSSSAAFETINNHIQNPKRFAAQLLPDYVS